MSSSALVHTLDNDSQITVTVDRSAGSDGAVVIQIDTDFEPDGSDSGPGLRVNLNDSTVYAGVAYRPSE